MKRSEYIAIGAIGLLAIATVWPRGTSAPAHNDPAVKTGNDFQTLAFTSVEECKASGTVSDAICAGEFDKAAAATMADAPKYQDMASCEAEYGANRCRSGTWNGAAAFIPILAGVLVARSLANAGQVQGQPLYPARTGPASCPPGATADRPECAQRTSGGSSSGSSGRSYYSTGTGRVIGRTAGAVLASAISPSRTSVSRSAFNGSTIGRSSTPGMSSSPTVSRGGFGSTSRSMSSGS